MLLDRLPQLLDENLPKLLESAVAILESVVQALVTNADKIGEFITTLITKSVNYIVENLPKIVQAGMTILTTLLTGLAKAMPELVPAIIECIGLIANTLTDPKNLRDIIIAAIDIVLAIVDGIVDNLDKIMDAIILLTENVQEVLTRPDVIVKLINASAQLMLAIVKGIAKAGTEIIRALITLTGNMANQIIHTDWGDIGRNIVDGLLNGLKGAWNNLTSWWNDGINSIVDSAKNLLGIHSPSKVFASIGENMALGLSEGWDNEFGDIRKDIENGMDFDANIDSNFSTRNSSGTVTGVKPIALTLNIDNFNNYTDKDIDTLADKLMYIINEKTIRQGAAYA